MCEIAADECVSPPDNFDIESANRAFYRSRFGAPSQIKRFSHALSSCFLESNHHDFNEITLAYDNSQGKLEKAADRPTDNYQDSIFPHLIIQHHYFCTIVVRI